MRILGLIMVRNGHEHLSETLASMSTYCDAIYMLDDRSTDDSLTIARACSTVKNIFCAEKSLSHQDWYFQESSMYELLYRMADFYKPDWIIQLDDDEYITPGSEVRQRLQVFSEDIACIKFPKVSIWNDPDYPLLVPLMGQAMNRSAAIWRYFPGLYPHTQALHNPRYPSNIESFGKIIPDDNLRFVHRGWGTLESRIRAVDRYTSLDPGYKFNHGVPYDKGLLFGHKRDEIDLLISNYRVKYAAAIGENQIV